MVVDWWSAADGSPGGDANPLVLTTVATWRQSAKDILPRRSGHAFELAVTGAGADTLALLAANGWRLRDAIPLSMDILPYRSFIRGSGAEFTVAKDQYVAPRSGWFKRPQRLVSRSRQAGHHPGHGLRPGAATGRGLFAFSTVDDILLAIEAIAADYGTHARAAREIAVQHFGAEIVLGRLLAEVGL